MANKRGGQKKSRGDGIVSHNALRTIHSCASKFDQSEVLHKREGRSCDVGL